MDTNSGDRVVVLLHVERALWQHVIATSAKSGQPTSHHVAEALTEYLAERSYDEARLHPRRCGCGRFVTRPEQCDGPPCPFNRRAQL